jgi:hypothetical protein
VSLATVMGPGYCLDPKLQGARRRSYAQGRWSLARASGRRWADRDRGPGQTRGNGREPRTAQSRSARSGGGSSCRVARATPLIRQRNRGLPARDRRGLGFASGDDTQSAKEYDLVPVVPRTWTHLLAEAAGEPVDPKAQTARWRDYVARRTGLAAPEHMAGGRPQRSSRSGPATARAIPSTGRSWPPVARLAVAPAGAAVTWRALWRYSRPISVPSSRA